MGLGMEWITQARSTSANEACFETAILCVYVNIDELSTQN